MAQASYTRKQLADLILERLQQEEGKLQIVFSKEGQINSAWVDDLLPMDIATEIYNAYPSPEEMAVHKSMRENKRIAAQMDLYDPLLEEIVFAFQDERIVAICERFTRIQQMEPDAQLYAGGISLMSEGNFLNPHLDNSHDGAQERYRVLNLLYYVSPNWKLENGGNLELWDHGVHGEPRTIVSQFNRLAFMITNKSSYHSVSKVVVNAKRCCVSNYYFSTIPAEKEGYFHVTSFYGRPEEPVKQVVLGVDRTLRNFVRKITGKKNNDNTSHLYKKGED